MTMVAEQERSQEPPASLVVGRASYEGVSTAAGPASATDPTRPTMWGE